MNPASHRPADYRADVDGLRAIAVLAVLFYHADLGAPGGYVGVDVFFVISGYLITGLILKDLERGQFSILRFWERRIRRIMPALAVVVVITLISGWFLLLPVDFENLGRSVLAQSRLASKIFLWRDSGYFAQAAEMKPLLHTWSLAVEEQFYLLFPILLAMLWRISRRTVAPAILLLLCVSFCLSVYCSYTRPHANFYLLPPRAWELATGALLAVLPARRAGRWWLDELACLAGLAAIAGAIFLYGPRTRFPGATALPPCLGAALVIWSNGGSLTTAGKILAARPVVFIGLVSYSLYLWHWPLLVFTRYTSLVGKIPATERMLLVLASVLIAAVSWKWVETPFRKGRVLGTRPQVFTFAGAVTIVLCVSGLVISRQEGFPSRLPAEALAYASGETDRAFRIDVSAQAARNGDLVELGAGDRSRPIRILVWGDSHAMAAMPILDMLCREHSVRGVAATHSGTIPLIGFDVPWESSYVKEARSMNAAIVEFNRARRIPDVLLIARWGGYVRDEDSIERLRRGLFETISALGESGSRVWIMRTVPRQRGNVPRTLVSAVLHGRDPEELGVPLAEHRSDSRVLDRLFEGLDDIGVTVLDPSEVFVSPNGRCRMAQGGQALYWDRSHLTVSGAMLLRPVFEPIFSGAAQSAGPPADENGLLPAGKNQEDRPSRRISADGH